MVPLSLACTHSPPAAAPPLEEHVTRQRQSAIDLPTNLHAFDALCRNVPEADLWQWKAVYTEVVQQIWRWSTVKKPYVRPTASRQLHPFVQTAFPEVRRDKLSPGKILSKRAFIAKAIERPSPFQDADQQAHDSLPEDLREAIAAVSRMGADVVPMRKQRLYEMRGLAEKLGAMRRALDACKCETAQTTSPNFNVAWTAAMIDGLRLDDHMLPVKYVKGFEVVFEVADSHVFKADEQPAEIAPSEFMKGNTRMVSRIEREITRSFREGDEQARERRKQAWIKTQSEISKGHTGPARSKAWMDKKYGRGKWRCMGRSAIYQKSKWRCIDNGKRSKHNKAATLHERITCGRADFPITVAREFAKAAKVQAAASRAKGIRKKRRLRMRHGTDDLQAAYRRVPVAQPQFTCVAVWNMDEDRVTFHEMHGHNFGLASAVINFNRFPELAVAAARRLLWIVTEHYYDDNDTAEPSFAGDSGQQALIELHSDTFFGFGFNPEEHVTMKAANDYLGVCSDLGRSDEGILVMHVAKKRRMKLRDLVEETEATQSLQSGLAGSIFGKSRFMMSPCYGSVGKACLQPIMQREYNRSNSHLSQELVDSLDFIKFACDNLPPMELPLLPTSRQKIVVFVDAEGKKRKGSSPPSGHLGFLVCHPVYGRRHSYARVPQRLVDLMDKIKQRDTYIGQFELVGAIVPFLSLPRHWFAGYPVELWIDNSMAVGGLIKGYSGKPDCARIINTFHFALAKLGLASVWIDYVPTESNPADVPSRFHEMTSAERASYGDMLGAYVDPVIPDFCDDEGDWFSFVDIAASAWR